MSELRPNLCYSQNGEDLTLDRLLGYKDVGFYIDVGPYYLIRFSNDYIFYRCGINIDAMSDSILEFKRIRQRDINNKCGKASMADKLSLYRFNEPALNTLDPAKA